MNRSNAKLLALLLAVAASPAPLIAQGAARAAPLTVGSIAPDFSLPGATRYGVLRQPVRLSDYRGRTVVLAFFSQARTKG